MCQTKTTQLLEHFKAVQVCVVGTCDSGMWARSCFPGVRRENVRYICPPQKNTELQSVQKQCLRFLHLKWPYLTTKITSNIHNVLVVLCKMGVQTQSVQVKSWSFILLLSRLCWFRWWPSGQCATALLPEPSSACFIWDPRSHPCT